MYPCLINTVDEQCFLYFLSLDSKTGKSKLYKAQLHNQIQKIDTIEKDLVVRQIFILMIICFYLGFAQTFRLLN